MRSKTLDRKFKLKLPINHNRVRFMMAVILVKLREIRFFESQDFDVLPTVQKKKK